MVNTLRKFRGGAGNSVAGIELSGLDFAVVHSAIAYSSGFIVPIFPTPDRWRESDWV
jgi:hypothetical protein